jgi:acetyl esterase/lipase
MTIFRTRRVRVSRHAFVGALSLVVSLTGCGGGGTDEPRPSTSPAGGTTPANTTAGQPPYDLHPNLAYAAPMPPGSTGHLLDLYVPTNGSGPFPVVIWQGGSAWYSNQTKDGPDPPRLAWELVPFGYAVAAVNTRNTVDQTDGGDDAHWPDQLYDIKAAIQYLRSEAAMYHLDEQHFGIIGDSSGGWTAAMAGVTGDVQSLEGSIGVTGESSTVQAVVDLYGPTDFLEMDTHACRPNRGCTSSITHDAADSPESDFVGCPIQTCKAKVERANPVNYVTEDDPPFLIMHGEDDDMVPHYESVLLFEALRAACVDVLFISLPNHQHEHHYLDDPNESEPRFVQTVQGCNPPSSGHAPAATYGTIRLFFDALLK